MAATALRNAYIEMIGFCSERNTNNYAAISFGYMRQHDVKSTCVIGPEQKH